MKIGETPPSPQTKTEPRKINFREARSFLAFLRSGCRVVDGARRRLVSASREGAEDAPFRITFFVGVKESVGEAVVLRS